MAQKVVIQRVDDIDGTVLSDSGSTVAFALDGANYEIDLSEKNAAKLRSALAPYIAAGRKTGGSVSRKRAGRRAAASGDATAVREWARAQGIAVSARGRVAAGIVAQYRAAH